MGGLAAGEDDSGMQRPQGELDETGFRQLVELCPDAMIVHRAGRLVFANAAAAELVGAAGPHALVGRPILDFVAPASRAVVTERLRRMMELGTPEPLVDEEFVRLDGTTVEVETAATPLANGATLVVARDVSRRTRAERETVRTDGLMRAFFEASSEALAMTYLDRHVLVNPAYVRLYGFAEASEVVGRAVGDLIAPSDREKVLDYGVRRTRGESAPEVYLARGLRSDGTEFDMDVRVSSYADASERYAVVALRDVTSERASEATVRDSERRYRELFDSVPVGLWEEDLSGARRIMEDLRAAGVSDLRAHFAAHSELVAGGVRSVRLLGVNQAVLRTFGARSRPELLAAIDRVLIPASYQKLADLFVSALDRDRPLRVETWFGTLQGDRRYVQVEIAFPGGHELDWKRTLISTVDITDRRRAEEERTALQERLRQAEKLEAVGRLAGGVAHDFNNILGALLGYTELTLAALPPRTEAHENLLNVKAASLRARDLVRQILAFSRREPAHRRPVDVRAVAAEAMSLARAAIPSTIELVAHLDGSAGVTLGDPTQIHQVILNLCANARDAIGDRPGRIDVSVDAVDLASPEHELRPGPYVRLRVSDDGSGMTPETRAHLFEPYMTTKGRARGHGLGLAVAHGIVTAGGGSIAVDTAPDRGSTFDVYLPRLDEEPPASARSADAVSSGRGERILLVDDEPLVASAHQRVIGSLGYRVDVATNGEEALARVRASPEPYALVVTDQTMPRLSGADLTRILRREHPRLPVLLCTGFSEVLDDAVARDLGASGLLIKPIDRETFGRAIRAALDEGAASAPPVQARAGSGLPNGG